MGLPVKGWLDGTFDGHEKGQSSNANGQDPNGGQGRDGGREGGRRNPTADNQSRAGPSAAPPPQVRSTPALPTHEQLQTIQVDLLYVRDLVIETVFPDRMGYVEPALDIIYLTDSLDSQAERLVQGIRRLLNALDARQGISFERDRRFATAEDDWIVPVPHPLDRRPALEEALAGLELLLESYGPDLRDLEGFADLDCLCEEVRGWLEEEEEEGEALENAPIPGMNPGAPAAAAGFDIDHTDHGTSPQDNAGNAASTGEAVLSTLLFGPDFPTLGPHMYDHWITPGGNTSLQLDVLDLVFVIGGAIHAFTGADPGRVFVHLHRRGFGPSLERAGVVTTADWIQAWEGAVRSNEEGGDEDMDEDVDRDEEDENAGYYLALGQQLGGSHTGFLIARDFLEFGMMYR